MSEGEETRYGKGCRYAALAGHLYNGCAHGCVYCTVPIAAGIDRNRFFAAHRPRANVIRDLEMELSRARAAGELRRVGVCAASDAYQPIGVESGVTRRALEALCRHGCPILVLTKGGTRAVPDFDVLSAHPDSVFGASLTFISDEDSVAFEPGAALPADRFEALRLAKEAGITTWAFLEPVIDPEQSLEIVRRTHAFVDQFIIGKLLFDERAERVDWPRFRADAVALLESLAAAYRFRPSLREPEDP